MISSQLSSILETYRRGGGSVLIDSGAADSAAIPVDGDVEITVASVPDAETVMLFAEVGRLPHPDASVEGEWVFVDSEEDAGEHVGQTSADPCLVYQESAGTVAVTASASVLALSASAFAGWIERFAHELADTRSAFDEILAEAAVETPEGEFSIPFGQMPV